MNRNVVLGVLFYNLQWVVLILLFRPFREVEYSLAILHFLSSGIAAIDNINIYLYGVNPLITFLAWLGLGKEHVLFAWLSVYLIYTLLSVNEDIKQRVVYGFKILGGILLAMVLEIMILIIWIRYLYTFFR